MSHSEINAFWVGFLAGVVALVLIFLGIGFTREAFWHNEAVKSGHAEYYLDENFNKQWRWK